MGDRAVKLVLVEGSINHEPGGQAHPIPDEGGAGVEMIPVQLTVGGGTLRASVPAPARAVSSREMLPVMQSVAEAVIHLSIKAIERQGRSVSCRAGCGACCRQFVPISETEARELIDLVEALPEPRRSQVKARFASAAQRVGDAGLREPLLAPESQPRQRMVGIGVEYFKLGIPCPFLEDESCSIHPSRPIICREYLVTSPAENCSVLKDIDEVPLPYHAALAVCRLGETPTGGLIKTVPLTMIFEWAKTAAPEPPPRMGPEIMREFLAHLARAVG